MATYNIDFYGRSKYGTATGVEYSAEPFRANEFQYGRLLLQWATPLGDWTLFRLVKNLSGFAAYSDDGEILIDNNRDVDGAPATQYDDLECVPGRFYYYTIFVGVGSSDPNSATWWRAGNAMNIAVANLGWTDRLWDWIPRIYKRGDGSTVVTDTLYDENEILKRFLNIFGYQLDSIATSGLALGHVNNVDDVSYQAVAQLGNQFGVDIEPELGPRIARTRVKNATYINQLKGTTAGLQALISSATGWDADIEEGSNLLINSDQASFVNPSYPQWNAFVNYAVGEIVNYNSNLFRAAVGNYNQAPPLTRVNNTQWTYHGNVSTNLENPVTKGQSTWGIIYFSQPGVQTIYDHTRLGVGVQSATDSTVYSSNSLTVTNKSGVTTDVGVLSVSPVHAPAWSSVTSYVLDNFVTSGGTTYRAILPSLNKSPATNPQHWRLTRRVVNPTLDPQQVIQDSIPIRPEDIGATFAASAYSMAATTVAFTRLYISWYDEYGNLIGSVDKPTVDTIFDSLGGGTLGSAIQTVTGGAQFPAWSTQANILRSGLDYVYRNPAAATGYYTATTNNTRADCYIGVTIRRLPGTGTASSGCGLVGRWVSDTSYFRVRPTQIELVTGVGTSTVLATFGVNSFTEGDRMVFLMLGSNIGVYKNNTLIWQGTNTTNQTATRHGIWVGA